MIEPFVFIFFDLGYFIKIHQQREAFGDALLGFVKHTEIHLVSYLENCRPVDFQPIRAARISTDGFFPQLSFASLVKLKIQLQIHTVHLSQ
jgi:hypothetical protein